MTDALQLQASVAKMFFEGKPFQDWKNGKEGELKMQAAIVNRLNELIRATGIVVRTLAKAG
ncbi:MAG: hypothetical protein JNM98_18575 [Rhodocyclaceae bacterium]|nr:hypothetical protein [Rhodocyclaceae bacterium]